MLGFLRRGDEWSLGLMRSRYTLDERAYLYARIQAVRAKICDVAFVGGILVDLMIYAMRGLTPEGTWFSFIADNVYICAVLWMCGFFLAKSSRAKQVFMLGNVIVTLLLCAGAAYDLTQTLVDADMRRDGPGFKGAMASVWLLSYIVSLCAMNLMMCWVNRFGLLLVVGLFVVNNTVIWHELHASMVLWSGIFGAILLGAINHIMHLAVIRIEERELKLRLVTMPRRMALSLSSEEEKPRERFCVCLSSDWRDYQELVAGLADQKVADLLDDYYQRVQDLLVTELDGLDYYLDWIADELFLVIYSDQATAVDLSARQAISLRAVQASQLIFKMKEQYAADHSLSLKIDVGLSAGQSLIGVLGPSNHRKATALGSTPGRSRRMQGCGKLLRDALGQEDRIVFGDEVLMVLQAPTDFQLPIGRFEVDGRRLRNLDDKTLFFMVKGSHLLSNVPSNT